MELIEIRKAVLSTIGATLRCINSDSFGFEVGKDYKPYYAIFAGMDDVEIGPGYSLNGYSGGYYKVEGSERVLARFKMIKDRNGRYVKRNRNIKPKARQDFRRLRRLARNLIKVDKVGSYEYNVIRKVANYAGK